MTEGKSMQDGLAATLLATRQAEIAALLPTTVDSNEEALRPSTARFFTSASDTQLLLLGLFAQVSPLLAS